MYGGVPFDTTPWGGEMPVYLNPQPCPPSTGSGPAPGTLYQQFVRHPKPHVRTSTTGRSAPTRRQ